MPPRPTVDESEIQEAFLKGTGPGGQKIVVVKSQETRSRSQNRKIARRILAERLEEIELGDQSRKAVKAQLAKKKKASADKKKRRKYRMLREEQEKGVSGANNETHDNNDEVGLTALAETVATIGGSSKEEEAAQHIAGQEIRHI
ncbi:MAG: hypothetical protein Q9165_007556 [Trypethelium subeluteriae]